MKYVHEATRHMEDADALCISVIDYKPFWVSVFLYRRDHLDFIGAIESFFIELLGLDAFEALAGH